MARIEITIPYWLDFIFVWPLLAYRKQKYGESFRKIYLGEGLFTILGLRDYYRLSKFNWYIGGQGSKYYALRTVIEGDEIKTIRMHREIMKAPAGLVVDHRNSNSLDNLRSNLRIATQGENTKNRRKTKSKTSSQFRGVYFDRHAGRWASRIKSNGKDIWLGLYDKEIDAAKAYDAGAKKYHGEFAHLNFPD